MTGMLRRESIWVATLLMLLGGGCGETALEVACDGGGLRRVCAWNPDSCSYDRDCRMTCVAADGPNDAGASADGPTPTTYYSNDPRLCPARD
jgi:hypothetical protein